MSLFCGHCMNEPCTCDKQEECEHEKVYAPFVLTSFPAQHPWICKKCGYEGVDRDSWPEGPSYDELRSKFGKRGSSYLNSTVIGGNKNE